MYETLKQIPFMYEKREKRDQNPVAIACYSKAWYFYDMINMRE